MAACALTVTHSRKLLITNDKLYRTSRCRTVLSLRASPAMLRGRRMDEYWIWWILATVLVGAELLTGTFYLLAVGLAFASGGVLAWPGAPRPMRLLSPGGCPGVGNKNAHHGGRAPGGPPPPPGAATGKPGPREPCKPEGP